MKHINLSTKELVDIALARKEGTLADNEALVIYTGKYTGRSPDDKFIVDDAYSHDEIAWGKVNRPISKEDFNAIKEKVENYLEDKELYVFKGFAGADPKYRQKFEVVCELASQCLFISDLLIRPTEEELKNYGEADYRILVAPNYKCDPEKDHVHSEAFIGIDYGAHEIVICGSMYCGEIKKSVFSTMNFIMPKMDVLPMHCSANMDPATRETAIFFGLSGTGKTTLSADENRMLIGDDEHGFSDDGVFNIEGGCYAKCINLSKEKEPQIYNAIRYGSIVENVVMDENGHLDFDDAKYTENTRVGYPLNYIDNAVIPSVGGIPSVIIFLTADAFGVLPPISKLSKEAAMYHFVTGFTSKLAGTERGVKEPQPTFSTLFGEPFMPLRPQLYARMLGEKLEKYGTSVYLINTGWSGGSAASGAKRIDLKYTRAMVTAALNNEFTDVRFEHSDIFNLDFPVSCPGVPEAIMDPRNTWEDPKAYDKAARELAAMFINNFRNKYPEMDEEIVKAGPQL
ncbi:MAG: phosphoenolpyruvate carboxykinase (ATP) [Erysipelotrichaceae bacterium]|nr:phosphoenolpyruvate carboxykinase (ATP) [Erysipelotrichaceae bacterium]